MKSQKGHRYSNLNSSTKSASRTNTHTTRNFRYRNVLQDKAKQMEKHVKKSRLDRDNKQWVY